MKNDLTLADFIKVAAKIGFTDQEIGRLFETEEIHNAATPSDNQKSTFDKILSLSMLCGDGWLDGPSRFRVPEEMTNQPDYY